MLMRQVLDGSMEPPEWDGIATRALTLRDADWQRSLVEVDVPAGIQHPRRRSTRSEAFYAVLVRPWNS